MDDMRMRPDNPNAEDEPAAAAPGAHQRAPSRSQLRRDALDVLRLAQALIELSDAQLRSVPLPDDLRDEVQRARAVRQQIARKRQAQFVAKQMRKLDVHGLDAIRAALEHDRAHARQETARLHQAESWRERLIADPDQGVDELLQAHPGADRRQLRALARRAREERNRGTPLHAYRELFREIRFVLEGGSPQAPRGDEPD